MKVFIITIVSFICQVGHAHRLYHFEITVNENAVRASFLMNRENNFTAKLKNTFYENEKIWNLKVMSKNFPQHLIKTWESHGTIIIKFIHNDPYFNNIDFHALSFEELILYLNNENQETK